MKKVAVISTVGLMYDGITSVILSYLEAMDRTDLDIYVIATINKEDSIVSRFEKIGCSIVDLPSRKSDTLRYFKSLVSFLKSNKIDIIHAHGNSSTLSIEMLAGLIAGCKKRLAHSHNTTCNHIFFNNVLYPIFKLLYTDALACGEDAGKWMFRNRPFTVLKNGRDVDKYKFNKQKRLAMRKKLSLNNNIVFGHVGGFNNQKNHKFLIEIFREILKVEPNSILILIGDGPLRTEIEKNTLDIKSSIKYIGLVNNVQDYLNAMDVMILPSLYEGLPLVAIEWQVNGLPSLLSDSITKDCAFSNNVKFLSLNKSYTEWAESAINLSGINDRKLSSEESSNVISKEGFNINKCAENLLNIYLR